MLTQLAQDTLATFPPDFKGPYPWHQESLRAILAVSDHNADLMRLAQPQCPVLVTYNRIELDEFPFRPWSEKRDVVVLNWLKRERKNPRHMRMVLNLLRSRAERATGPFAGFQVQVIQGVPDSVVRATLKEAKLLLFLSNDEGLGLLALEAIASGVVVLGYDIGPMDEFLPAAYRRPWGDIEGLLEVAESVADPSRKEEWSARTVEARKTAEKYSQDRQVESVLSAYGQLL